MLTFHGMRMRTEYMTEEIRRSAIDETIEKFEAADRHYYETCEGGDEVVKLIHELESLGVDMEYIVKLDLQIRDDICGL